MTEAMGFTQEHSCPRTQLLTSNQHKEKKFHNHFSRWKHLEHLRDNLSDVSVELIGSAEEFKLKIN